MIINKELQFRNLSTEGRKLQKIYRTLVKVKISSKGGLDYV